MPEAPHTPSSNGHSPATSSGILPDLVGFNLRLAYYRATQLFAQAFDDLALTPIQFAALAALAAQPGLTQRELAARIGSAPSVLVAPLRELTQHGWLQRDADPADRRTQRLRLTAAGARLQTTAHERIGAVEAALLADLTLAERATLLALLQRITTALPATDAATHAHME